MRRALSVVWFSIRVMYDDLLVLTVIGGLWLVVSLLVPSGVFWLTRALPAPMLTIPLNLGSFALIPPCTSAVFEVAVKVAREERIEFGHFWQGLKAHWKTSYKIAGILGISGGTIIFSLLFYFNNSQNTFFVVLGFLGLGFLVFWLCIQTYLWPLAIRGEKRIVLIMKNTSLLTLAFPVFTLVIAITLILVTALSVALPLLLLVWMPFVAILSSCALESSLERADILREVWREREVEEAPPRNKRDA